LTAVFRVIRLKSKILPPLKFLGWLCHCHLFLCFTHSRSS